MGADFTPSIESPFRWQDWAGPDSALRETMIEAGELLGFVNAKLLPYLKGLRSPDQLELLRHDTFFGREKETLIYPIALANLVLPGIALEGRALGGTAAGTARWVGAGPNFPAFHPRPPAARIEYQSGPSVSSAKGPSRTEARPETHSR